MEKEYSDQLRAMRSCIEEARRTCLRIRPGAVLYVGTLQYCALMKLVRGGLHSDRWLDISVATFCGFPVMRVMARDYIRLA